MTYIGAMLSPRVTFGALACGVLMCLFVVSAVALVLVLVRRNRPDGGDRSDSPAD